MGDGGGARTSRASARWGGREGRHVGREEGSRGLLAAYLSIVAFFFFFFLKPHREYTARAQVPLKKGNPEH